MLTSKQGFYERFVAKKVGQRMRVTALRRALFWLGTERAEEYGIKPEDETFELNGILVTCWRKPDTESFFGGGATVPMHKIKLELKDVLINNIPLVGMRRRSRKVSRLPYGFRIALSDICFPDSTARGNCLGIAGFLASGFPAPDKPPEEQKTHASYGDRDAPGLTSRPLESGGGNVAQGDPNAVWRARSDAKRWFKAVQEGLRRGDHRAEKHLDTYRRIVSSLRAGVPFREILDILAPLFQETGR